MLKKKQPEISADQIQQQAREKTAQQWMPLADIRDCVVYRKDGALKYNIISKGIIPLLENQI